MKLYMTRIAQAALISSAAIISSSAFALASSNIGDSASVSYTLQNSNQVAVYVYTAGGVPQKLAAKQCKVTEDSFSDKPQLKCGTTPPVKSHYKFYYTDGNQGLSATDFALNYKTSSDGSPLKITNDRNDSPTSSTTSTIFVPTTLTKKDKSITCTLATNPVGKYSQYTLTSDQTTAIRYSCSKVPQPQYWIKIQDQNNKSLIDNAYLDLEVYPATSDKMLAPGSSPTLINNAPQKLNGQYWIIDSILLKGQSVQLKCKNPAGEPNGLETPLGNQYSREFIKINANTKDNPEVITYQCP